MKTLTVFTPTYNRKHTLPRTFESLCRQTCDDFEWLIIDDGSSDGTREWVESLDASVDGMVQFIKDKQQQQHIVDYLRHHDYGNESEVEKIYNLL